MPCVAARPCESARASGDFGSSVGQACTGGERREVRGAWHRARRAAVRSCGVSKLFTIIGVIFATVGLLLLLTVPTPTRAQLEGGYGDLGGGLQQLGGWIALICGLLVLAIALVRALKAGKHDPDLPPELRV